MRTRLVLVLPLVLASAALLGASRLVADDEAVDLDRTMGGLKDHLKPLARIIADPAQNETSLGHLAAMQALVLESKKASPPNLADVPEEKRAQHVNEFQRDLALTLRELVDMEIEVREGKNAAAGARIRATLVKLRDDSHEKYQREE